MFGEPEEVGRGWRGLSGTPALGVISFLVLCPMGDSLWQVFGECIDKGLEVGE